ncbi:MAG TPA: alpha/beta hydrolase [Saprospiraceae bacterium]|nr:alpha/beta hydrolase [Saprospiraceae bacterium]
MKHPLLLLHGALGATDQFVELKERLQSDFEVYDLNFSGHGGNLVGERFSIDLFVCDTLSFLDRNQIPIADIFGYSMGGYVALKLASDFPGRVNKIITFGTKFNWTKESAEKEVKMLIPDVIEEKVPHFAAALRQRHSPEDWKLVITCTAQMMLDLGNGQAMTKEDFQKIENEVMICVGSEDNMVTFEESKVVADYLPKGIVKVVDGFKHPIEAVDKEKLVILIKESLKEN